MWYLTRWGGVQKYFVTDTCNKPRVAIRDGNNISYAPMKTTTVTVSTSIQITSTTGTTYNTLQKTTSGGGSVAINTCNRVIVTVKNTVVTDLVSGGSAIAGSVYYGYSAKWDTDRWNTALYTNINNDYYVCCNNPHYERCSLQDYTSIGYLISSRSSKSPYGSIGYTYSYRVTSGNIKSLTLEEYYSSVKIFKVDVISGSNNIYYTVTTAASFGTRTSTISKELTVVTYV